MEMVFKIWKITAMACGGLVGWMIGEFKPAFLWPSWPSCLSCMTHGQLTSWISECIRPSLTKLSESRLSSHRSPSARW